MTRFLFTTLLIVSIGASAQTNTFPSSGSVGIGTTTPNRKLQVNSDNPGSGITDWIAGNFGGTSGNRVVIGLLYGVATIGTHNNSLSAWDNLALNPDGGNVGIGTSFPAEKLSVNGNIRAKEVKVETANWPDYVFETGYKLPTLKETENYIRKNGHLPEIPTAIQAAKEGINIGEINAKLLKKIEELTLHLIEKDKELQSANKRIDLQQQQLTGVISKVAKLEKGGR